MPITFGVSSAAIRLRHITSNTAVDNRAASNTRSTVKLSFLPVFVRCSFFAEGWSCSGAGDILLMNASSKSDTTSRLVTSDGKSS